LYDTTAGALNVAPPSDAQADQPLAGTHTRNTMLLSVARATTSREPSPRRIATPGADASVPSSVSHAVQVPDTRQRCRNAPAGPRAKTSIVEALRTSARGPEPSAEPSEDASPQPAGPERRCHRAPSVPRL
jgi:hypothetical protein